jgi:hypothetical protein
MPPPSVAATSGTVERIENPPPAPPKKKRGFWSKVFGKGKNDEAAQDRDADPPKKKTGG